MMVLNDGPCKGAYAVGRAPDYLRAVIGADGKADVLDQLHDEPGTSETVHIYRRLPGKVGGVSVMLANPRRCIWTISAEYEHLPDVDGKPFRETEAWREWALAQPVISRE